MAQTRFPVTLNTKDEEIARKLRPKLEEQYDKTLTIAEVIRLALRNMAINYGID